MTSHSERKPRVDGRVTEENIVRWAGSKESGRLGELSRMVLDERKRSKAILESADITEGLRKEALVHADGYRRWWILWPLIKRLR